MPQASQDGGGSPAYFSAQIRDARRFHLRWPKPAGQAFRVVSGGWERCREDYVVERRGFPRTIVELVVGGAGWLVINGEKNELGPGSVFSYGREVPHRISSEAARPMVKYFVELSGVGARAHLRACGLLPGSVGRVAQPDRPRQVFDDLIGFALGDRADREACCVQAARYALLLLSDLRAPADRPAARAFATYARCRDYIEENRMTLREIREVAQACHVDESYMCRLFQRFGRERPFQYLQHLRMNHAAAALQFRPCLIKDLAVALGFSDAANFTRAFRRWFGVPPQKLRTGHPAG